MEAFKKDYVQVCEFIPELKKSAPHLWCMRGVQEEALKKIFEIRNKKTLIRAILNKSDLKKITILEVLVPSNQFPGNHIILTKENLSYCPKAKKIIIQNKVQDGVMHRYDGLLCSTLWVVLS